ncbi:MAG: hypothetical protein ACT4QD_12965 [Acidobacteriota bacterium]
MPRTVTLVGAVGVTAGWLLASIVSPPVARVQSLPERRVPAAAKSQPEATLVEPLKLVAPPAPTPPTPGRNPFVFEAPTPVALPMPTPTEAGSGGVPTASASVSPVTYPTLTLAGIATRVTPAGLVRTAVLSDGRSVFLARAGEAAGVFQVLDVAESSVIVQREGGPRLVLELR